ncbi:MAG: class B sortase, partial [Oscillospiraceae bacterium]
DKDKDKTDKDEDKDSTVTDASGANAQPEKKPYEPKYTLASLGTSGAENIPYWKTKNSDVIGWLRIPNTNIDFPVVVGPDSLYYNEKGYDKETSKNGVIWADSATNFGTRNQISQNTVLYGHNWTNYSSTPHIGRPQDIMFAQLTGFHHLDFAKNTPYIYYSTESEEMVWKVFASLYTETKWNYLEADAGSGYMQSLISKAKTKSMHNYNVDVNANDKILTLSTCTRAYGQRNDQRFVVMARLVRKGEAIDEVSVTANANFETPQF